MTQYKFIPAVPRKTTKKSKQKDWLKKLILGETTPKKIAKEAAMDFLDRIL